MAQYRGYADSFTVGYEPPSVAWTVVKGDTASFRVYVTDNEKNPLDISAWFIAMDFARWNPSTETYDIIESTNPEVTVDDGPGEFTASLTSEQSEILLTGDVFDIQMSNTSAALVWTVARGTMNMIEDYTD